MAEREDDYGGEVEERSHSPPPEEALPKAKMA